MISSTFSVKETSNQRQCASCGADWATSMASSWMENPADMEGGTALMPSELIVSGVSFQNVSFMHAQTQFYRMRQVESLGASDASRSSSFLGVQRMQQ